MSRPRALRQIGRTGIWVTPVAFGGWPISGMTSRAVRDEDSVATIRACSRVGINFLDTAYCYGANGESERLIATAIGDRRDEFVIATKGGIHWAPDGTRVFDARAATLKAECEESLRRLQTDRIDLLYLHAPDPATPLAESARALAELRQAGKTRAVGVSNLTLPQLEEFHAVCPIDAFQPPYNMLQRQIEQDTLPWCHAHGVSVMVYWPLMKGLLAGRLPRDYDFAGDGRAKYPMYHGAEWQKNQDFVDKLREVAESVGKTVAQVVINWTIHRPGITVALCGAKRPEQIEETAGGMGWQLGPDHLAAIDRALADRGEAIVRLPV